MLVRCVEYLPLWIGLNFQWGILVEERFGHQI